MKECYLNTVDEEDELLVTFDIFKKWCTDKETGSKVSIFAN